MEITKLYYSIGEVSEMLGLKASQIRHWEKEIKILSPKKNRNGNRAYTQKDIDSIKMIRQLVKQEGYTLDGANRKLLEKKKNSKNGIKLNGNAMSGNLAERETESGGQNEAAQLAKKAEVLAKLKKIRNFLETLKR